MNYREQKSDTIPQKQEYVDSFRKIIQKRNQEAKAIREGFIKNVFEKSEVYRDEFAAMLGWPLTLKEKRGVPAVTSELLSDEGSFEIYRMSVEVIDDLKIYGLFFKQKGDEKRPLVVTQHGAIGSPELISGILDGTTHNYNHMMDSLLSEGMNVFAPQTLTWYFNGSDNDYGVEANRVVIDAALKRTGSSAAAIEVYAIKRIIDFFENQAYVSCIGMVGLSYGGFYTLFTTAMDTRIKAAVSSSYFNNRDYNDFADWAWWNAAHKFGDAEIACMIYPRKLWIGIGTEDAAFAVEHGKEEIERLKALSKEVGTDWVDFTVAEARHEFCVSREKMKIFTDFLKNI